MWGIIVKNRTNMKMRSGKYMWSRDLVVMENKKVKVDYIISGKWDFDVNGFLGFWIEEGEWIYHSAIGFLRGFFLATIGKWLLACSNGTWLIEHWYGFHINLSIFYVLNPFSNWEKNLQESLVHVLTFFFQGPAKT